MQLGGLLVAKVVEVYLIWIFIWSPYEKMFSINSKINEKREEIKKTKL